MTFPSTSATIARTDAANTFTGVQTMTSPVLVTPTLGVASATSLALANGTFSSYTGNLTGSGTALTGTFHSGGAVVTFGSASTDASGVFLLFNTAGGKLYLGSGISLGWSSSSSGSATTLNTADTSLARSAAGQLDVGSGASCATAANCRDLRLRHLIGGGTAPTVANTSANSCGTSAASITGTDTAGKITVGATSGTSCTITFGTAWTNAPSCWATDESTLMGTKAISTTTTLIISATAFTAGDVIAYGCHGYQIYTTGKTLVINLIALLIGLIGAALYMTTYHLWLDHKFIDVIRDQITQNQQKK